MRGSCRPMKTIRCSRPPGSACSRDQDAVRDHLELAREPVRGRFARGVRDGDAPVDPVHQEAPRRMAGAQPAEAAGGVEGGDDRAARPGHRGGADDGRHRLVQVQHVEPLALEHLLHARDRARAEDDVRQRAVGGDDHRAPDRDHVRRRLAVPPVPRVQHAREAPRRVVAHHGARLDPVPRERGRLQLGVLGNGAPIGPGVRDDDADLHRAAILTTREPRRDGKENPYRPPRRGRPVGVVLVRDGGRYPPRDGGPEGGRYGRYPVPSERRDDLFTAAPVLS